MPRKCLTACKIQYLPSKFKVKLFSNIYKIIRISWKLLSYCKQTRTIEIKTGEVKLKFLQFCAAVLRIKLYF